MPSKAEENVELIRRHLIGAKEATDESDDLDSLDHDAYELVTEETTFHSLGRSYKGREGVLEYIEPVAEYKQLVLGVRDLFASDDRICAIIDEACERVSDGKRFEFVRKVIYELDDNGKLGHVWISDDPYTWGLKEYHEQAVGKG